MKTALLLLIATSSAYAQTGVFTLKIGTTAPPPLPLVRNDNFWHFHKGTNAPQGDWKLTDDDLLDPAAWLSGRGGFGYGDNDDTTVLGDMRTLYSTIYIRQSFVLSSSVPPDEHLRLVMDYDDAFVVWLDGTEIARSANAPGATGFEPANNTFATSAHESTDGLAGGVPLTLDLGPVGGALEDGTHVLAVMGFNDDIASSDLTLKADLLVTSSSSGSIVQGTHFALIQTNQVFLTGTNTMANSTRVTVNGIAASYNPVDGTWSRTQPLSPGMNRLFIAAHDASGTILASTNRDIIYEATSATASGTLAGNTAWTSALGVIHVTGDVIVPSGVTLSVGNGVIVLLNAGVSIRATAGGAIDIAGTAANPDFFLPADGTSNWGAINANGAGASITARHIETAGGAITFNSQANGLIEDSYLHDRGSILTANGAGLITTRRIHVKNYDETIYNSGSTAIAEDSLYEGLTTSNADALEIQGGQPGSIVRRCTFRRALGPNSDAVDFNGTSGALVQSCLIHDITDKGISLGASGQGGSPDFGIGISNCLIYRVDTGIALKDSSTARLSDTTIADSVAGMRLYQKFSTPIGGGRLTNGYNNLIWGNGTSLELLDGAVAVLDYSDVQGTNWPGTGNIDANPLFVNAAASDYHLSVGSPAKGAGLNGADMGVKFPVGGLPPAPWNLAVITSGNSPLQLTWQEDADNETAFAIERSTNAVNWELLATIGPNQTAHTDGSAELSKTYFYRVRAQNPSGDSPFSNIASGIREVPTTYVGGTLAANTTWTPAMGNIVVASNLTVPANITLTVLAGSRVKMTNGVSLRAAAGGRILVSGTEANPVTFTSAFGTNVWGELAADGADSSLTLRHVETQGGAVKGRNGAILLLEDCYIHNYKSGTTPIAGSTSALDVRVTRCHFAYYHETLWQFGFITVEDSIFENADNDSSDALDFDGASPGSSIRRCTFRHGPRSNTDAIDLGSGTIGVLVEDCLMYDFPFDKGVSIGESSFAIVIRNCLMYGLDSGVAVKDSCMASINNCTIVNNDFGFRNYNKANPASPTGGGHITNSWNNILWNNNLNISLLNASTLVADHSDFGATNWAGAGNISADPLFVNAAQRDYRLQSGSPCIGTGRDGENIGAHYPVGSVMAPSHPYFTSVKVESGEVVLQFWADNEKTYTIQKSASVSGGWIKLTNIASPALPKLTEVREPLAVGETRFYRIVTPALP